MTVLRVKIWVSGRFAKFSFDVQCLRNVTYTSNQKSAIYRVILERVFLLGFLCSTGIILGECGMVYTTLKNKSVKVKTVKDTNLDTTINQGGKES